MIRYALICAEAHEFEAWFSSSEDYDKQVEADLVECPHCGSLDVRKAIMAPAVATSRAREARAESRAIEEAAAKVRAHIRKHYDYVGEDFAAEARAIHAGDKPERLIYGEASAEETRALAEDGVPVAPLPGPFAPTPPKKAH